MRVLLLNVVSIVFILSCGELPDKRYLDPDFFQKEDEVRPQEVPLNSAEIRESPEANSDQDQEPQDPDQDPIEEPDEGDEKDESNDGESSESPRDDDGLDEDQDPVDSEPQEPEEPAGPIPPPFELPDPPNGKRIPANFVPFEDDSLGIQRDLIEIRRTRPSAIPYTRYITVSFINYLNYEDEEQLIGFKSSLIDSLSVMLNHLSTEISIARPSEVSKSMDAFRIDLRDFGWTIEQWERLVFPEDQALYGAPFPYLNPLDEVANQIAREIGTKVPIVRADWLMFRATQPQFYHDLVNIPNNLTTLENSLAIRRIDNIGRTLEGADANFVQRAALSAEKSGVSINNRIIERHESALGYYWVSYDFAFAAGDATKNIFGAPLGPGDEILQEFAPGNLDEQVAFIPDGGEVIFTLPNGLQGYMLVDGANDRIDEAPTNVVFDPTAREETGEISNGYACMTCHGGGIIATKDEMQPYIRTSESAVFTAEVREAMANIYPPQYILDATYDQDNQIFTSTVNAALLIGPRTPRITQLVEYFEEPMSFDMVASELNITVDQLAGIELKLSDELRVILDNAKAKNLDRGDFEAFFGQLLLEIFVEN